MSRIPSPSRSAGGRTPPRRYLEVPRSSRSVCSPRSTKNTRLSAVVQDAMGEQSFVLSPIKSSFLSDNTDVLEPRRKSWWKKLGENTAEDMAHFHMTKVNNTFNILEEYEQVETNSQEDKNYNLDLPESSGSESIGSIVVPQRRLFTQKESRPQNKLSNLIENRDHVTKHHKTPKEVTKTLEVTSKSKLQKSRPIFPAALLTISFNKSKEIPNIELKAQNKKLFGNRATNRKNIFSDLKMVDSDHDVTRVEPELRPRSLFGNKITNKRTNMFTDIIATESDNEIPDVQPRIFTFKKFDKSVPKRRVSSTLPGFKEPYSPSSSVASDTEFNNWKMLPSSTMVEENISVSGTPAKRPRLNKLSELKESEDTNKTTDVDKGSNTSKNKSTQLKATLKTNRTEVLIENNSMDAEAEGQNEVITKSRDNTKNNTIIDKNKSIQQNESNMVRIPQEDDEMEIFSSERSRIKNTTENIQTDAQEIDIKTNQSITNQVVHDLVMAPNERTSEKLNLPENNKVDSNEPGIVDNVEQLESDAEYVIEKVNKESEKKQQIKIGEESGVDDDPSMHNDEERLNNDTDNGELEQQIKIGEESGEDDNPSVDNDEEHLNYDTDTDKQSEHDENDFTEATGNQSVLEDEMLEANQLKEMENTSDSKTDSEQSQNESDNEEDERLEARLKEIENTSDSKTDPKQPQNESDNEEDEKLEANQLKEIENTSDSKTDSEQPQNESDNEEDEKLEANQLKEMENTSDSKTDLEEAQNESDNDSDEVGDNDNYIANKIQYSNDAEEANDSDANIENEVIVDQSDDEDDLSKLTKPTKRNTSKIKSPEIVLQNKTNFNYSYEPATGNTTNRKTNLIFKGNPSLVPIHDSIDNHSDGTKNSTTEGSGWDSHRTTRKTIRQTMGKDFDIRKSLRALVMEKSTKTLPVNVEDEINDSDMENNEMVESVDDMVENVSEVQRQEKQITLEACLQRMAKNAIERRNKVREAVINSLKVQDSTDDYYKSLKRMKPASKPVKRINHQKQSKVTVPIPRELVEDLKYKPPKRFAPRNANWITKRLYKHIETKLEPKYNYRARVRAEKFVECLYEFTKRIKRHPVAECDDLDLLKREMARLNIVTTHYDFYDFFSEYMPREVRMKVNPDIVNKLPVPKHVFSEILRPNVIQE